MFRFFSFARPPLAALGALTLSSLTLAATVAPGPQPDAPAVFALASAKAMANG